MKIACVGSHGTGKTAIVENINLSSNYKKLIKQARKNIINDKPPHLMSILERKEFQSKYWQLQLKNESLYPNFISDRSLFDILAYNLDVESDKAIIPLIPKLINRYDLLMYFPIEFDISFDSFDKIRNVNKEYQIEIDNRIVNFLNIFKNLPNTNNTKIITISGSIKERADQIKLNVY